METFKPNNPMLLCDIKATAITPEHAYIFVTAFQSLIHNTVHVVGGVELFPHVTDLVLSFAQDGGGGDSVETFGIVGSWGGRRGGIFLETARFAKSGHRD